MRPRPRSTPRSSFPVLRSALLACGLLALSGLPRALAGCKLKRVELPVTMIGLRPMVHAAINGTDALFVADSGAFFNTLTPAAAAEFKLHLEPPPPGFFVTGVGGAAQTWLTNVKTFTLLGWPFRNVEFLVAGNDLGGDAVGLLGQNVFRVLGDVEYDLAKGVIWLVRTKDCEKSPLAYWATSQPYSVIDIEWATPASPHTAGVVYVNGARIRAFFDTGAATSVLTLDAAKRAGVTPTSPGVVAGGPSWGIGRRIIQTWIAPFASFKIGDEEVRNTRMRFGAEGLPGVDMLIGADFFLSHHIYVANSQRKLYLTYNGGPVFNLTAGENAPAPGKGAPGGAEPAGGEPRGPQPGSTAPNAGAPNAVAPNAAAPGLAPQAAPPPGEPAGQAPDASALARRGAASAARRDFVDAIADLTRACELAPNEASYFYERGMAYRDNKQPEPAMADFNRALELKPDDLPSLVARAGLHVERRENPAAISDLDAADRIAPREGAVRVRMGDLYLQAGRFAAAVAQYTYWLGAHDRSDVHTPEVLALRCRARAFWGEELGPALTDCDAALKARPNTAAFLASRGLLELRRADYDKAIADYDRALRARPEDAWSQYGRGIARLRKGMTPEGRTDIAAATALQPNIAEEAAQRGITP